RRAISSSLLSSRNSLIFITQLFACLRGDCVLPADEPGLNGKLRRSKSKRFTRNGFGHAIQFKENVARPNGGDPEFRVSFSLTHSGFRWSLGYRLVWENLDPELSFSLHVASQRNTGRLDLGVRYPGPVQCLQCILAERDRDISGGVAAAISSLRLTVLHPFWHQWHTLSPY